MRVRFTTRVLFVTILFAPRVMAQDQWPTKRWPTSTPAAVGLDARALAELDADLAGGKYGYVDSMLVIRHGKAVYDRSYKHDYDRIYGEQARKQGPLNAHDPTGPYNYYNPWWHPFYRRGELHTMQSVIETLRDATFEVEAESFSLLPLKDAMAGPGVNFGIEPYLHVGEAEFERKLYPRFCGVVVVGGREAELMSHVYQPE